MPLLVGKSKKSIQKNIIKLMREGKTPEQAAAIAYETADIENPGKAKASEEQLYDKKTFLANILPKTNLFDGDKTLPLSDPTFRTTVVDSMKAWVDKAKPNILKEHKPDGGSYGIVEDVYEDSDGIFAKISTTSPDIIDGMANGKYRYVSPTIAWNFKADDYNPEDGNSWPASLLEVSLVSVPRHFTRQVEIQEDKSILSQYGELNYNENTFISQFSAELAESSDTYFLIEEDLDMNMEELAKMLGDMLDAKLAPLMERLEVVERDSAEGRDDVRDEEKKEEETTEAAEEEVAEEEAAPEDKKEEVELAEEEVKEEKKEEEVEELAEEVSDEDPKDKEIADLKAKLAELEKASVLSEANIAKLSNELRVRDAREKVSSDISGKPHLSQMSEKLVGVFMKDEDLYNEVVAISGGESTASILSQRSTTGYAPVKDESSNPYDMAHRISKAEGISYKKALEGLIK